MSKSLIAAAGLLVASMTTAMAADMRMPVKAPPVVDPPFSWTGFYLGGNVGYSWGRARNDQTDTTTTTTTTRLFRGTTPPANEIIGPSIFNEVTGTFPLVATNTATTGTSSRHDITGVIGGAQVGYNWQVDRFWVVGVEADIQGSGERGSVTVCTIGGCPAGSTVGSADVRLRWFGTARARVGILPIDKLMLYGTGGLAYGQLDVDYLSGINGGSIAAFGTRNTRVGYAVGAGVEGALDRHWSVKGEYLFMDLGTVSSSVGTGAVTAITPVTTLFTPTGPTTVTTGTSSTAASVRTRFWDHIFRIGFNYRL
jgi:outer membrane immunogenic protein